MDWNEIGKWALALATAVIGGGIAFKYVRKSKSSSNSRTVIQKNNKAGRDIIGGDSTGNSNR